MGRPKHRHGDASCPTLTAQRAGRASLERSREGQAGMEARGGCRGPLAERLSGHDLPHPAPFGLAICAAILVKQFMSLAPPAAAKN